MVAGGCGMNILTRRRIKRIKKEERKVKHLPVGGNNCCTATAMLKAVPTGRLYGCLSSVSPSKAWPSTLWFFNTVISSSFAFGIFLTRVRTSSTLQ